MEEERILDLCMRAGLLLLLYGGETSRVEETMTHLAVNAGVASENIQTFVTPTGLFLSMATESGTVTRLKRVTDTGSLNLAKVTEINDLSRRFARGDLTVEDAFLALERIERAPPIYPIWLQRLAAAISSGSFTVLLGGGGLDFLWGALAGLVSERVIEWLMNYTPRFLSVLLAALIAAVLAVALGSLSHSSHEGAVITGAVLPLLPGIAVTNSIRDLLAGDLLSGVARGAEALLTAVAIAVAVAVALGLPLHL